ncbi:hypothetical protein IVB12_03005 [Bradyrhizobium sp. 179]|uniref:hypothetical protein n=1 Tax=Bradyrhizobium sp. 179 TaxID=2782648 RepID=UPI001FFAD04E|nr:hypothetical protein [Bradyrhizobium sp. 179]MCK1540985.1 hypothetical protein [Bradyrhizobium sp. 179]
MTFILNLLLTNHSFEIKKAGAVTALRYQFWQGVLESFLPQSCRNVAIHGLHVEREMSKCSRIWRLGSSEVTHERS